MDIRQLEYFMPIARHGGVRHAAEDLNLSPGNLSEQIKSLENELGVLLVGALPGLGPFWLSRFLVDFLNCHRHVDLRLIERGSGVLLKLLGTGEVHAACVLLPGGGDVLPPGISAHRLLVAPLAVVVSPQHPLATCASVSVEQLASERLILTSPEESPRLIVDDAFHARGLEPAVCFVWAAERGPHTRALDTFLRFVAAWWRDHMNPSWEDETGRNGKGQVNATQ